ncbi:MAG: DNA polymerase III subunit gamma/tau [Alphaproteobacteria bacterium]|nr:MAG: DNA polymerase III subunit gamma/tau [Alphaproteobacteria bacterium]
MTETTAPSYQVLARKYRPQVFADLIGQEAMVRTLTNAFAADRLAHAFILTGVRGVGKTTTARIIARGLNCIGPDGTGGMTVTPCGVCAPCRAIAEGRHVDVLEMDAATHTQVERMRELLASVPYRPTEARMKVYIIDEVHMLSTASFNALLKTLEEPPEHVKFIFATTEIRKVPVTVLSRCQRFDLRRVEPEVMLEFLAGIAAKEGAEIPADALALITRAAEGSVRDALSLLDQAIAHGGGSTDLEAVRAMLGLADRGRVLDLFDLVMKGDVAGALAELGAQYAAGADPLAVLRDLAEVTHWVSLAKAAPRLAEDPTVAPDERRRGAEMAEALPMPALARMWQMLLKALDEVARAPNAMMAAEMAIIRLTHVADLPSPGDLVRRLQDRPANAPGGATAGPPTGARPGGPRALRAVATGGRPDPASAPQPVARAEALTDYPDFDAVLALIRDRRDLPLLMRVERHVRLVGYAPGRIEFQPTDDAPVGLAAELGRKLGEWTGQRWAISIAGGGGEMTIAENLAETRADLERRARDHPLVRSALEAFPGARIVDIRPEAADEDAGEVPEPWMEDDWDPFDPDDEED